MTDQMRFPHGPPARDRLIAIGAMCVALLAAGAAITAWDGSRTAMTEVLHTTCGVSGSDADLTLPLDLLRTQSRNLPLRIGPMGGAAAEPGITLEFRTAGADEAVHRQGAVISLPLLEDARGRVPRRVILACREGRVAEVRYEWRDGSRRELPVPAPDLF